MPMLHKVLIIITQVALALIVRRGSLYTQWFLY